MPEKKETARPADETRTAAAEPETAADAVSRGAEKVDTLIQKLEMVKSELRDEESLLKQDENYIKLLTLPNVSLQERMDWLREIFGNRVSDETMALICVLSQREGMADFYSDIEDYMSLLAHENAVSRGIIYSVTPLTEQEINAFRAKLEKLFHKNVILVNRIDKNLIGGVSISVDGKLIDMSIRKKLEDLHLSIDEILGEEPGK